MKLYVLRHAIAEDRAGGPDSQRQLTQDGRRKLRKVIATARAAGFAPDHILVSPYVRAVQTAQIAAEELAFEEPLIETDKLLPYSPPLEIWDELRDFRDSGQLLIVGHNPQLSELACTLLGTPGDAIAMKKAALACFELHGMGPQPQASLCWLLTPRLAGA
ncbi:MAG: phosphohistidine phosphatase SixA [Acidobacteria bacterium]|nr:phosphohistidine phosphatase SixA [Acidobacteriota bacterium]